jgi:trehalose-6-phosphate synthase
MEEFQEVRREVEGVVGRINGAYGTMDWRPVLHFYGSFDRPELVAFYRAADLIWVTPLRDGLNLVVKEYVASKPDHDGVVVLSEFAGVAAELPGPILVNPYSPDDMDRALDEALSLLGEEREERMRRMRERVLSWNVQRWAESFLEDAHSLRQPVHY